MPNSVNMESDWINAIREVNAYFAQNNNQLAFGQISRADNLQAVGQQKTSEALLESELESFKDRVDTHLIYMEIRQNLDKSKERPFGEIYFMSADKRSYEEQTLVQEAMSALSPAQISEATKGATKVKDVMQLIEHSKLSKVVGDMANAVEEMATTQTQNPQQTKGAMSIDETIWGELGNILGKIFTAEQEQVPDGTSVKPNATPPVAKSNNNIQI